METSASNRPVSSQVSEGRTALLELDLPPAAHHLRSAALEVADIVQSLEADDDVVLAAMLQPLLGPHLERTAAERRFGPQPVRLAVALGQLGRFGLPADSTPEDGLESGQA